MFERFSDESRRIVVLAQEEARSLDHGRIGTEHLLLGLLRLEDGEPVQRLTMAGVTLDAARHKVIEAVGTSGVPAGHMPFTARAKRALERAHRFSLQRRDPAVDPRHVLHALIDVEGTACQVLRGLGVNPDGLSVFADSSDALEPDDAVVEGRRHEIEPRCAGCGVEVHGRLTYRRMEIADDNETETLEVVISFCSNCGTTFGVNPA